MGSKDWPNYITFVLIPSAPFSNRACDDMREFHSTLCFPNHSDAFIVIP